MSKGSLLKEVLDFFTLTIRAVDREPMGEQQMDQVGSVHTWALLRGNQVQRCVAMAIAHLGCEVKDTLEVPQHHV